LDEVLIYIENDLEEIFSYENCGCR